MFSVKIDESTKLELPGRDVYVFVGADKIKSDKMTVGMTEVPPESCMTSHTHHDGEEIIFIIEGHGEAVVGGSIEKLEPKTAVVFPLGIEHKVHNIGKTPMRFVFMFSPPHCF